MVEDEYSLSALDDFRKPDKQNRCESFEFHNLEALKKEPQKMFKLIGDIGLSKRLQEAGLEQFFPSRYAIDETNLIVKSYKRGRSLEDLISREDFNFYDMMLRVIETCMTLA